MTDNEVTMNDVETGLVEIQNEEEKMRILLFEAISSLPASKIHGMLMVILEKNLVFREWSEKHWNSKMIESGTEKKLDRTRFLNWIKKFDDFNLYLITRNLIWQNETIEELFKKKLLVEQKDGTFAIRKFELDAIGGHSSG
ncbi:hypothetical protein BOTCAL_0047g00330 [Botryotinia calthae]|uniref:Uncharacterized protein n=1 Tax=Botryotinia calthae TaxID=38488 RepID=A0A4Y8DBB2_9HELO|nr:hypothetical protein BOTCAL_0047g00330 [Botryotinia calthae]